MGGGVDGWKNRACGGVWVCECVHVLHVCECECECVWASGRPVLGTPPLWDAPSLPVGWVDGPFPLFARRSRSVGGWGSSSRSNGANGQCQSMNGARVRNDEAGTGVGSERLAGLA